MSRSLVTMRVAELSDAPALAELWTSAMRRADLRDHIGDLELIIKAASASPEQRVVVAEYDGVLAGAVLLRVATLTGLNLEPTVQAISPHVFPQFRRRGIGQALMECAVAFAEEIGIGHITTAASSGLSRRQPVHGQARPRPARHAAGRAHPRRPGQAHRRAPGDRHHQRSPPHPRAGRPAFDEADPGRPLGRRYFPIFSASTSAQVIREVQTRLPRSSVIATSNDANERPRFSGVATPVTTPDVAARWWVALMSTPTHSLPSD